MLCRYIQVTGCFSFKYNYITYVYMKNQTMSGQELKKEQELILASIEKVVRDYESEVNDLVEKVKKQSNFQWQEFNTNLGEIYFKTCGKLFGIHINLINSMNKEVFTFEKYVEKRDFLKNNNDSIFDKVYSLFFPNQANEK